MGKAKLDIIEETAREAFLQRFKSAAEENDTDKAAQALGDMLAHIQESILDTARAEAKTFDASTTDTQALKARGLRLLTAAEKSYFEGFIEAAKKSALEKAAIDFSVALPETEINAVFEDIKAVHPLLQAIKFTDTAALAKFLINTAGPTKAVWGQLNSSITKEIEGSIDLLELTLGKITAFMPISNDMLNLGPIWVERYVRTSLVEALSMGCADGILNGNGINGAPIGMRKNVSADVTVSNSTGYPDKEKTAVADLSPKTYGAILASLAESDAGRARTITEVVFIVNPVDYFAKVFAAKTYLSQNGVYVESLPFPTKFIQEPDMPKGEAIIGIADKYFFGVGAGTTGGKIEDDAGVGSGFLDDVKYYKIKMYGTGRAYDDNCFKLLDISKLTLSDEAAAG